MKIPAFLRQSSNRSIPAFTLIELLVTISILAILCALLLPALHRARARAHTAVCLSQLRQWGVATQLYTNNAGDFLPPEGVPNPDENDTNKGWYIQLPREMGIVPYHEMQWRTNARAQPGKTVWLCPANLRRSNGRNLFHYCLNDMLNGTGEENRPVRISALEGPSTMVWLFDSKNLPAVGYYGFTHTNLHQAGADFLFLDSHAERLKNSAYWDMRKNRARTNNPAVRWQTE
jgi:prepilin-type N-terminal cleavage/methylation domain-containing protein